ncbi:MAG: hypothetical protein PVG65_03805 [Candidatus Thorarchaeota archaeon]
MAWKDYMKKAPELIENNTKLDMEVTERFREMLDDIKDTENAVSLEFLKSHLRLRPEDTEAIQELKLKVDLIENLKYRVIVDETDQSVYIQFMSEAE